MWDRRTTPPDDIIISRELRMWYGFIDHDAERERASAEQREWKKLHQGEVLGPELPADKRNHEFSHRRQTG